MKKSLTADRRNRIAQMLLKEGSVKVGELAQLFDVSTETIRKDIIYLEEEGIAEKNHGGAIAKVDVLERTLDEKEWLHSDEKAAIATVALSLVPAGSAIILDTGSTTYAIAKQLVLAKGFTVFTNSVITAGLLAESDNEIFMLGGADPHQQQGRGGKLVPGRPGIHPRGLRLPGLGRLQGDGRADHPILRGSGL